MNNIFDKPQPAELNRDPITQLVTRCYDDVRADGVMGPTFEAVLGGRRASYRVCFRPRADFDLIASETVHDSR